MKKYEFSNFSKTKMKKYEISNFSKKYDRCFSGNFTFSDIFAFQLVYFPSFVKGGNMAKKRPAIKSSS